MAYQKLSVYEYLNVTFGCEQDFLELNIWSQLVHHIVIYRYISKICNKLYDISEKKYKSFIGEVF